MMSRKLHKDQIDVYTDGSLRRTGSGKIAGYGIHFPDHELDDLARPFRVGELTNNRAELYAIYQAIRHIKNKYTFNKINIYTDSEYSYKSLTVWINKWKKNRWMNSKNKDVENKDLIKAIDRYLQKFNINIYWIRSHTQGTDVHSIGNENADRLAKEGADIYRKIYL